MIINYVDKLIFHGEFYAIALCTFVVSNVFCYPYFYMRYQYVNENKAKCSNITSDKI